MNWGTFYNQGENAETHEASNPTASANDNDDSDKTEAVGNIEAYCNSPEEFNFITLQNNLQNCLAIVDSDVMKSYVPVLQNCSVKPMEKKVLQELEQIQFFRISELVYQEDEFSVHKLATVFHALSNKPCTLVLLIQSDGENSEFYLGIRSRDSNYSSGTMRQLLEQSFLGMFPGSSVGKYYVEELQEDIKQLKIGAVSSVTSIADYKQDKEYFENKSFIQGLEKLVYGIQGKEVTVVCIANNLKYDDLTETRREYERIYTLMSPFANVQYNYALNKSSSTSDSKTEGAGKTDSSGITNGVNMNATESESNTSGSNYANTETDTEGTSYSAGHGNTSTQGITEGSSESSTITDVEGTFGGASINVGIGMNTGVTSSVSRGKTHSTSHTESISNSISMNLTRGLNKSRATGTTQGHTDSTSQSSSWGMGVQYSKNYGSSSSVNYAQTKALTDTFGNSQAITLNIQNKSLINTLERLEKQLKRLDECESSGMWDFAAYFLGESASEAEMAASIYHSLISGNQSGLQLSAVNTWTNEESVKEISDYVLNFLHPVFCYNPEENKRKVLVDATALSSTNELAIQMGLPRKSVKGLPVIEHALFAQEILNNCKDDDKTAKIELGSINCFGKDTKIKAELDVDSLAMHTFITGSTGSGKSNTVYQILSELLKKDVHFLVVEPAKGEYKNVFGNREDVAVYGTNPMLTDLLRINPFSFPKEIHIYEHLDRLVEIFNVCWPMYAAMPAVLKEAIERAYIKTGWDLRESQNKYNNRLFPNFVDVLQQIDEVMEESQYSNDNKGDYKGALCTRLRSLTNGINSLVFCSDELDSQELFDQNVIVDLSRVGSAETKSLIMGILIMKLQEYRMSSGNGMNAPLAHVTVLEEAHNLLRRTSTEQFSESSNLLGKSVEMLSNAIAEMRSYGEGFIIADQSPGLLDMSVIRNTNTKIIMRLPEYSDRELVGRAAGLTEEQIVELSKLSQGVAAVYQNNWIEPVLCKIRKYAGDVSAYSINPEMKTVKRNIKSEIINSIIAKDFRNLVKCNDSEIIEADLPGAVKCRLYDYIKASDRGKFDTAAALAYELFSAEEVFALMENSKLDAEQQKKFLIEHIKPSISPLSEKCGRNILYLLTYWHAHRTESVLAKELLNDLLEMEKKEDVIR